MARECCSELEAELFLFRVAVRVIAVTMVDSAPLVRLVFVALFAAVSITPDVVALELARLVADGQGAR